MGLIRTALSSVGSTLADQYKEYFYCDSIQVDVLAVKGQKTSGRSNNKGSDNIITSGSGIAVADGQCMLIVDQGKVVEVCAEPGVFTYDASTEPSVFSGKLGDALKQTFKTVGKRIAYGSETAHDQRVYYINTKELVGNKYGTANPVPFRVVDNNIGLDMDIRIRCFGEYSYHICDPLLFYTNVCGNVTESYCRDQLDSQLKTELLTALQPAFAKISQVGVRYSALPAHSMEIADALNEVLSKQWKSLRGIEIVSLGISSLSADPEDEKEIKELQKAGTLRNPAMGAGYLAGQQGAAMKTAAANSAGAMTGFMGMGMAQAQGGASAAGLYSVAAATPASTPVAGWTCSCGTVNTGKFCTNCGSPKPAPAGSWTCACGTVNTGKFCTECGSPKPAPAGSWTCTCGTENTGNFCTNCGTKRP